MTNALTAKLTADWDLQIGSNGSLLMCDRTEAVAQNIACACKNFRGGLYFYADSGIAWFSEALALKFRRSIIAARIRETAQSIEGVQSIDSVRVDALNLKTRTVSGEVSFTTIWGENGKTRI